MTLQQLRPASSSTPWRLVAALGTAALLWAVAYWTNERVWDRLFEAWGLDIARLAPGAVHFFLYDTSKVLLLLVGMIFVIGLLRTTIRPDTVRAYLLGKPLPLALVLAALLGAITPFCSCSSIPLFIGFVAAGIPLSVTLTFLVASPLVNEVAVVMLGQSFGWGITAVYAGAGLTLAVTLGAIFSRMHLEDQIADFVRSTPTSRLGAQGQHPSLRNRVDAAREETRQIVGRVWKWVVLGVAVGAGIHGWVPAELLARWAGPDNPLAVPVVTALGVPLYSNAAGVIPIAEALWAKGMGTGTVLAFLMATVALSVPELVLLRQVLKPRLLALFFGSVALGIVAVGVLVNLLP